jgi:hypothetical protein
VGTLIYQEDENGCGLASMRMFLCALTRRHGYKFLTLEGHPPYSLENLRLASSKEGVDLVFKKVADPLSLKTNKKWPILLLLKGGKNGHLVLAIRRFGKRVLIHDPADGKSWIKIPKLIEKWTGVFGEGNVTEKRRCPFKKPHLIKSSALIIPSLLSLVACACLFVGFYFLSAEGNYLFPILFFGAYGLVEITERFLLVKAMKSFDEKWLNSIFDSDPERLRKNFERYYSYKRNVFPSWLDFFEGAATAIGLLILVGMNEPSFFAAAGGMALYLVGASATLSMSLAKRKLSLEEAEQALFKDDYQKEVKLRSLKDINSEAYKIGDLCIYERVIFFAVTLVLALFPVLASEEISLNYYLLHFFALLAVGEGLKKVLGFFEEKPQREIDEAYFREYLAKNCLRK